MVLSSDLAVNDEPSEASQFVVIVTLPGTAERYTKSFSGSATIGRAKGSDIELAHPLVSRQHAEVLMTEDGFLVRDVGSRNGTMVNNALIRDTEMATGGDASVQIGPYVLSLSSPNSEEGETVLLDLRRSVTRLTLDRGVHALLLDGKPAIERLSVREFRLLAALSAAAPNVVENKALGDEIWGVGEWDTYMLHNLIRRVRAKLEDGGASAEELLINVPGVGYRLA